MRTALVLALGTVLLAACGQNPPPPPAAAPAPVTTTPATAEPVAATPAPVQSPEGHLWFEPAGLPVCEKKPQVVTVFWDARTLPGKGTIELRAPKADGNELTFATVGRVGKKQTGAWMRAGGVIIMRSKADGSELVRASVPALPCE
jgi:hypothetical protein